MTPFCHQYPEFMESYSPDSVLLNSSERALLKALFIQAVTVVSLRFVTNHLRSASFDCHNTVIHPYVVTNSNIPYETAKVIKK